MNDNHPDRPDDRTADECDHRADQASIAAMRAAAKVAEVGEANPGGALHYFRIMAKFAQAVVADRARAKALRP